MLDHIAINVANIGKSICWYSDLGFATLYEDKTWALLQREDIRLALSLPNHHPPHIAIRVVDTDQFPGGKIGTHRDGSKYLYQQDPDGNVIEWIYYP